MINRITENASMLAEEFLNTCNLPPKSLLVVGCSTSEMVGKSIGSDSVYEMAEALFLAMYPHLQKRGIFLAAQCCEHLNRALVIEKEAADHFGYEPVCVVPKPKAGGSFATACYRNFKQPVVVEHICAHAGIDIGGTLIGMHLKAVAVPLRVKQNKVGEASVLCAYSRPKLIGGARAVYE